MKSVTLLLMITLALSSCGSRAGKGTYAQEELWLRSGDKQVYGVLYRPEGLKKAPLVIFSHGFNGTHQAGEPYAKALASKGYAVYCFDFCGGSVGSRSEGSTTQMSIFSEVEDLKAVMDGLKEKEYIDRGRIILMGESQGGMVSALVGAERSAQVERLILIYPAFCIKDDWVKMFPSLEDMPEEMDFWGVKLGHAYLEGLYGLDVYGTIGRYEGPVEIFHGDQDQVVNISYSERAEQTYKDARLTVLPGEGHGFTAKALDEVIASVCQTL